MYSVAELCMKIDTFHNGVSLLVIHWRGDAVIISALWPNGPHILQVVHFPNNDLFKWLVVDSHVNKCMLMEHSDIASVDRFLCLTIKQLKN